MAVWRRIKTNIKRGPEICEEYFIDRSCSGPSDPSNPKEKLYVGP